MIVTDPAPRSGRPLPEVVETCLEAGATAVQLRHKGAEGATLYREAVALRPLTERHGALFLVNDRLDVAMAVGADGVHLGAEDLPVERARSVAPPGFVIGYSTDEPDEARRAAEEGASYLGVGSVYGTDSKEGLVDEAIGPERVGPVLRAAGLPGVGIGGIGPDSAEPVARTGAGVAVLSAAVHAEEPAEVVRRLRDTVDEAWRGRSD